MYQQQYETFVDTVAPANGSGGPLKRLGFHRKLGHLWENYFFVTGKNFFCTFKTGHIHHQARVGRRQIEGECILSFELHFGHSSDCSMAFDAPVLGLKNASKHSFVV